MKMDNKENDSTRILEIVTKYNYEYDKNSNWTKIYSSLSKKDTTFIRAGLSANASIILARADSVLTIKESLVQYDRETQQAFVEIETGDQKFERRDLTLGISDGLIVEVLSGISQEDKIKVLILE